MHSPPGASTQHTLTARVSDARLGTRRIGALALWLAVAGIAAAAPPRQPSSAEQQLRDQMLQMMGKAPSSATPQGDGVEVVVQTGHAGALTAVAISGNGRWVASGGMDAAVKLWDVASGQEIRSFGGQALVWPTAVAFAADDRRLIVVSGESARAFDTATGAEVAQWTGSGCLAAARGSRVVCETRGDGPPRLEVIETATGQAVWTPPTAVGTRAVALAADGRLLATLTRSGRSAAADAESRQAFELDLWDVAARTQRSHTAVRVAGIAYQAYEAAAALSPDGRLLAIETAARGVELLDTARGTVLRTLADGPGAGRGTTTSLGFSPDGSTLARGTSAGVASFWSIADGAAKELPASAIGWNADGTLLVLGRADGGAPRLRDLATGAETALEAGAAEVAEVAVIPGDRGLLAAMRDGSARWWDLASGQVLRSLRCPGGGAADSVAADPTAARVALGCSDGSASVWNSATGEREALPLAPIANQFVPVLVRYSGDGHTLLAARRDEIIAFDAAGSETARFSVPPPSADPPRQTHYDEENWIRALAVAPVEPLVAVGQTRAIGLWNYRTGSLVRRFAGTGMPMSTAGATMGIPARRGSSTAALALPPGMANPLAMLNAQLAVVGARSAAFSADGRRLLTSGAQGHHVWDVASGQDAAAAPATFAGAGPGNLPGFMLGIMEGTTSAGIAISPDGKVAARGVGRLIKLWDPATNQPLGELHGHTSDVTTLAFSADGARLASGGRDGSVRIWRVAEQRELASLTALGAHDFVAVTPDQYYRASKSRLQGVSFRVKEQLYPFDQFDLRFNRPDFVLERLGLASADVVAAYRRAYERRLKRTGFTEEMLGRDFHLPEVDLRSKEIPVTTDGRMLTLAVRGTDSVYPLDRFAAYVNDVPVFGSAGVAIPGRPATAEAELKVPLVTGRNKIQVAVVNAEGVESLRRTVYTNVIAPPPASDVWVVAIGVSHYANSRYDLRFAAKDAGDVARLFAARAAGSTVVGEVHVLPITDDQATTAGVRAARGWLRQAKPDDLVVVFAAGHGMTDADQNYYFGTFDIDPAHPAVHGLPFDEFESLFDGIAPLRKLLLVDTCFSGEIDRDEPTPVTGTTVPGGRVTMRAFQAMRGIRLQADSAGVAPPYAAIQQDLFADLRRGTGAAVVSSASGNEFALEGEQWQNGVFTYAVLEGLRGGHADRNRDGVVTVSELEAYVIDSVRSLTQGKQNPTVRRENLDYDFPVY